MSIRVFEWVFEHSTVGRRGDLLVLLVLASHAHDNGDGAWPSVPTIARKARLSRRGVQLVVMGGEVTSRGEVTSQRGRTERARGAKQGSPEPSLEPSGKNCQKGGEDSSPPSLVYPIDSTNGAKATFAAEHFPGVEPGYVGDAAGKLKRRRGTEPTVSQIKGLLREQGVML